MKPSDPSELFDTGLFFKLSLDLLCIAGFDGYFRKINPAVSLLLGYSEDELMSRPIYEFIHPEDREVTAIGRENLTKKMIPVLNFENRYVKKNGEIVWLAWTSIPLESERLVYAVAKNVTQKKELEEERNALITKLTIINQDLKQLTYSTSHDLRSPVNNLLSVFSLMDISKIQDEETLEFIGILKSATEGLKHTLNKYVDILQQKENLSVPVEELNFQETLDSVVQSVKTLLKNSKTKLHADFSEAQKVRFNKNYLESIFLNLITNSIKYTKPGYPPNIEIHSKIVSGKTKLIFKDDGMGFDMEKVNGKIFNLYQKFHHNIDSKGIGLYLVHTHVTALGGQISVESQPNMGAKFIIKFDD